MGWQVNPDLIVNLIKIIGANGGLFLYDASGNLIASVTNASTDPNGNTTKPIITVYGTGGNKSFITLNAGAPPVVQVGTGDAAETSPSQISASINGAGGTRFLQTLLAAATVTGEAANAGASVQLTSPSADLSRVAQIIVLSSDGTNTTTITIKPTIMVVSGGLAPLNVNGGVELTGVTGGAIPPLLAGTATIFADDTTGSAHLKNQCDDGVTYSTERITVHATGGQTINSAVFTDISGLNVAVGVGIYAVTAEIDLTTAAAAGQWELRFNLSNGAVTSTVGYSFFWESGAGVTAGTVNQTGIGTTQIGPNPSVVGPYTARFRGIIRFTTAGNLSVQAATTIAADTFTVHNGSILDLKPLL